MAHCFGCGQEKPDVEERYSYGIYAGKMCRNCAVMKYKDHCGVITGEQGDPRELEELGEQVEPE